MRAYLTKVSERYKKDNEEFGETYGYHEEYKVIDALLTINSRSTFLWFCFDLIRELKFEV